MSTDDLLSLSYEGEQDAFDELYRLYNRKLLLYLYRLTGDHHVSEDLMQETFLRAFESIRRGDRPERFSPWLFRIARNQATNLRTQNFRQHRARKHIPLPTPSNGQHELSPDLLTGMTRMQRAVLTRYYVHGENMRTIGRALGVHRNTVSSQLTQAQNVLRRRCVEGELLHE